MSNLVKPIPDRYHEITPYLIVKGASEAINFYTQAFGAKERLRLESPDGSIMHAEMDIGKSVFMLVDEFPDMGTLGPKTVGGTPVSIMIYVENADEVYKRSVDAGAKILRLMQDQFYGDRSGTLEDPFDHHWAIATHI
jgi:PhnB protein